MSGSSPGQWRIDDVPIGLLAVTEDGRVLEANARLGQMLGQDPATLVGQNLDRVFMPAARLLYHSYLLPLLKLHGHVSEVALPLRSHAGERVDTLFTASRHAPDEQQPLACVRFAFLPWRERRRLEDQLLSAKRAAEQVPGLLFELKQDASGKQTFPYASDSLRRLYGVPPQDALNDAELVWQTLHPEDLPAWRAALDESARAVSPLRCEYRVLLHGKITWRETHASPQRLPDGACLWHGYTADVTERKALMAQAMERDAAERASRAKSEFLARVSHELRTPLNGILGFSQLLTAPAAGVREPGHRRQVQYIESAGRALLQLVDEILDIAHIESGGVRMNLQAVDVAAALREAMNIVTPMARQRQVRLRLEAGGAQCWAQADAHRLAQCLLNLISNAVKYGPEGGEVRLSVAAHGARLVVSVTDQGPGLTPTQMVHLFEPFNRLGAERSQVEGSGLGLVITKGWIELMGGRLSVANVPGGGACFSFDLTLDSRVAHNLLPSPFAGRSSPVQLDDASSGPRVELLYVEDNEINAILMESILQLRPQCRLHLAQDAASALYLAQQIKPDLLLLDLHLPDMTGPELLVQLRCLPGLASVPAVAVSADAIAEHVNQVRQAGFVGYWTKPLDLRLVLSELDALLATIAFGAEAR
jgi:signal transduction histidine kinase/ActR/RegA family two-component response regulator